MTSSYEQEPIVELSHWSVYEVPLYGMDAPWTRHFVGFVEELGIPQVSSAILMFDRQHGVGASSNHRVFKLEGYSGQHPMCTQIWERWKLLNDIHLDRDVTPGYFKPTGSSRAKIAA